MNKYSYNRFIDLVEIAGPESATSRTIPYKYTIVLRGPSLIHQDPYSTILINTATIDFPDLVEIAGPESATSKSIPYRYTIVLRGPSLIHQDPYPKLMINICMIEVAPQIPTLFNYFFS